MGLGFAQCQAVQVRYLVRANDNAVRKSLRDRMCLGQREADRHGGRFLTGEWCFVDIWRFDTKGQSQTVQ